MSSVYDFAAKDLAGTPVAMSSFKGDVLLIVNVASKCGFTPQYAGLEALHRTHAAQGFAVLGFPCNQFGNQEPAPEAEIGSFCAATYDVTFPMFAKVDVNGAHAHPLFVYLKNEQPGILGIEAVKWNFTKFLVDRSGRVVERFAPSTKPESLDVPLRKLLAETRPPAA